MKELKIKSITILLMGSLFMFSCGKNGNKEKQSTVDKKSELIETKPEDLPAENRKQGQVRGREKMESETEAKEMMVMFVELGSVNCIPCKMMQPIMEEIEKEYDKQVKVIFYDVWTREGQPYAKKYGIRVIPTQVFLDKEGNEYYRHEGFFPKEELVKVLKMQGVK